MLREGIPGGDGTARADLKIPRHIPHPVINGSRHDDAVEASAFHQRERIDLEIHVGVRRREGCPVVAAHAGLADRRYRKAADGCIRVARVGSDHTVEHPSQHELPTHRAAVLLHDASIQGIPFILPNDGLRGRELGDTGQDKDSSGKQEHGEHQDGRGITLRCVLHNEGKAGSTKKRDVRPAMLE